MESNNHSPHSEASKLLEAALQQMDGIIQGAKYEIPNLVHDLRSSDNFGTKDNHGTIVPLALEQLKSSIQNNSNLKPSHYDPETVGFLKRWLANNNNNSSDTYNHSNNNNSWEDQRLEQSEVEREHLQLQVQMLQEQLERQNLRLSDLEQLLSAKKELLKKTELALMQRERNNMINNNGTGHLSELAHFKSRCAALEQENGELRKICGGNRTPKYLPISPISSRPLRSPMGNNDSSPDDNSPIERAKEVGFDDLGGSDLDTSTTSNNGRPPRSGFKKIFGKIKRSNSGGQLEDSNHGSNSKQTPQFQRGGFRATAGGRIGWSKKPENRVIKKPMSEWNVDMICEWMDGLGLGIYCQEIRRNIGTGEDLAKMSYPDLETKLSVKNYLHRKKLYLAIQAKQDTSKPDLEGELDFQWVLRWLDDIGLPQYKESFLENRVDVRVLNVLTVDDLFHLKITNQLHHLSIRRGIQVLRIEHFDANCFKRRAIPGEDLDKSSIARWSNHRVMEWLKQVDLAEYAPNLRGSGVHGGLLVHEPRFGDELMAALLSIPSSKTLLRRHLSIHFKELVGKEAMQEKRAIETDNSVLPLTPMAKAKSRPSGQFSLKRKKSRANFDYGDLVCPLNENEKSPSKFSISRKK